MEIDKMKLLLELKSNPKVQEYLAGFSEDSANQFLESYVSKKELLLQLGEDWRNLQHGKIGYFRDLAEEYYWMIAQKKLFNMQCLWRAGQIDLPVNTTWDFTYWETNIRNCPFIGDVTEQEMDVMVSYLEQTFHGLDDECMSWQAYDEFKDEDTGTGAGDDYPGWYAFYDSYMSTSNVMLLPDVAGTVEKRYLSAWHDVALAGIGDRGNAKPMIFCDQETTEDFMRKFEPYKIQEYYRLSLEFSERSEFRERLENVMQILKEEEGEVYMPEGTFPDAIFQALRLLKASKMKQLLPEIHREHMETKSMGISYTEDESYQVSIAKTMIDRINEGKRLLGEV